MHSPSESSIQTWTSSTSVYELTAFSGGKIRTGKDSSDAPVVKALEPWFKKVEANGHGVHASSVHDRSSSVWIQIIIVMDPWRISMAAGEKPTTSKLVATQPRPGDVAASNSGQVPLR